MKNIILSFCFLFLFIPAACSETRTIYQDEAPKSIYDDTIIEQKSSETTVILNNKLEKNKFKNAKNKSGKSKDYIIVPDESNIDVKKAILNGVNRAINDPYVVKVNNVKYYMIKNSKDGQYTLNNIVGYGDKKTSLFSSLIALNSDNDKTKLTKEELEEGNIRFAAVNSQGKLMLNNDKTDLKDVVYIDLSTLKESINNGKIGSFGYFDVYIKTPFGQTKKIIGYVSFDSDEELSEMLK